MKAAVIHQNGGPDGLHCEDLPDPVCTDDDVVIDVETVSIESGNGVCSDAAPAHTRIEGRHAFGRVVMTA